MKLAAAPVSIKAWHFTEKKDTGMRINGGKM